MSFFAQWNFNAGFVKDGCVSIENENISIFYNIHLFCIFICGIGFISCWNVKDNCYNFFAITVTMYVHTSLVFYCNTSDVLGQGHPSSCVPTPWSVHHRNGGPQWWSITERRWWVCSYCYPPQPNPARWLFWPSKVPCPVLSWLISGKFNFLSKSTPIASPLLVLKFQMSCTLDSPLLL